MGLLVCFGLALGSLCVNVCINNTNLRHCLSDRNSPTGTISERKKQCVMIMSRQVSHILISFYYMGAYLEKGTYWQFVTF